MADLPRGQIPAQRLSLRQASVFVLWIAALGQTSCSLILDWNDFSGLDCLSTGEVCSVTGYTCLPDPPGTFKCVLDNSVVEGEPCSEDLQCAKDTKCSHEDEVDKSKSVCKRECTKLGEQDICGEDQYCRSFKCDPASTDTDCTDQLSLGFRNLCTGFPQNTCEEACLPDSEACVKIFFRDGGNFSNIGESQAGAYECFKKCGFGSNGLPEQSDCTDIDNDSVCMILGETGAEKLACQLPRGDPITKVGKPCNEKTPPWCEPGLTCHEDKCVQFCAPQNGSVDECLAANTECCGDFFTQLKNNGGTDKNYGLCLPESGCPSG
jgi:hypothetical protein